MMEKLVFENDALADHLNKQALELSGLRSAMATAAQFAQAADADAAAAEAYAAATVGYLPPVSPMRQQSGGLGGLHRQVSDSSAMVAAAAGLQQSPSQAAAAPPTRPSSAGTITPAAAAAAALPMAATQAPGTGGSGGANGAGGAAWELPGGVMLSEQQLQLLALAEEVSLQGRRRATACCCPQQCLRRVHPATVGMQQTTIECFACLCATAAH